MEAVAAANPKTIVVVHAPGTAEFAVDFAMREFVCANGFDLITVLYKIRTCAANAAISLHTTPDALHRCGPHALDRLRPRGALCFPSRPSRRHVSHKHGNQHSSNQATRCGDHEHPLRRGQSIGQVAGDVPGLGHSGSREHHSAIPRHESYNTMDILISKEFIPHTEKKCLPTQIRDKITADISTYPMPSTEPYRHRQRGELQRRHPRGLPLVHYR